MLDDGNKGESLVGADDLVPTGHIDQLRASIADFARVDALVKMGGVVDEVVNRAIYGVRVNINVDKLPGGFVPADSMAEIQSDPNLTAEDIYEGLFGTEGPDQHPSV